MKVDCRRLERDFYERPTLEVARDLLGKVFVNQGDGVRLSGRIVEVEAYIGENDPACHARFGPTDRNRVMYGPGGHVYIYFIYGMYNMLNFVTEKAGKPAAVLIRALEPIDGIEIMKAIRGFDNKTDLTNGPGKLCQAFSLKTSHTGTDLTGDSLYVEEYDCYPVEVVASPRIGIRNGTDRRWRFYSKESRFVSRR
jgi:DNA-3-methyladenine glycosylase